MRLDVMLHILTEDVIAKEVKCNMECEQGG